MSGKKLPNSFEKDPYEIKLNYLQYGKGESNRLVFPMQVRERHLTPGPTKVQLQAVGPELQISAWSCRDNIIVRIPLDSWNVTKSYNQKMSGANNGVVSVGRFENQLLPVKCSEDDKEYIHGLLYTHEWDRPNDE